MKSLITVFLLVFATSAFAQTRVNPVIKNYGGIFPVADAVEKPDPNLTYNIVIEIERASENPTR